MPRGQKRPLKATQKKDLKKHIFLTLLDAKSKNVNSWRLATLFNEFFSGTVTVTRGFWPFLEIDPKRAREKRFKLGLHFYYFI